MRRLFALLHVNGEGQATGTRDETRFDGMDFMRLAKRGAAIGRYQS